MRFGVCALAGAESYSKSRKTAWGKSLALRWRELKRNEKETTSSVQGRGGGFFYCVVASPGEATWWESSKLWLLLLASISLCDPGSPDSLGAFLLPSTMCHSRSELREAQCTAGDLEVNCG